jgi:CheY-like chemotaxis protein
MAHPIPNKSEMPSLKGSEIILVVDDESFMRRLAVLMLERYGYNVLTATSGREALRMFEVWPDSKIDLAVIDIVMPEMDGFELAERIRNIRPRLPILYMSAYPEKAELPQTLKLPFVPKPFTSVKLAGKIREVLDAPRAASSGAG